MRIEGQQGRRAGRSRRTRLRALPALALILALVAPGTAPADPVAIPGRPLRVWADGTGTMQVRLGDAAGGFWAPGDSDTPAAGFWVRVLDGGAWTTYGPPWLTGGTPYTGAGPVELEGGGTPAAPYETTARFSAGPLAITQRFSYVDGTREVQARYELRATEEGPVRFEAWSGGDLAVSGFDEGTGTLTGEPGARTITARSPVAGGFAAAEEVGGTPWTHVFEGAADSIQAAILSGEHPEDGASETVLDNGIALSWAATAEAADPPVVLTARWRFGSPARLTVDDGPDGTAPGRAHTIRVGLREDDAARAGATVRWRVTGVNPSAEVGVVTDPAGTAELTWPGTGAGADTLRAYADLDGDGEQTPGEPALEQAYEWAGETPAPTGTAPVPTGPEPTPDPPATPTTATPPPATPTRTTPASTVPAPPAPTQTTPPAPAGEGTPAPAPATASIFATPSIFAAPSSVAIGPDRDGDGVADAGDGCPAVSDPAQPDADRDGIDDGCDANDGSAPPVVGKTIGIRLIGGTVLVRYPAGSAPPRALRATANTGGSLSLKGAWTVPVGVRIDAAGGVVRVTAATGTGGGVHVGEFFQGVFMVRQKRAARASTTLVLAGGSFRGCTAAASRRVSTRRVRSLWGEDAGGRFRTVGAYSVGTVRGTRWLTTDRCDGTVTTVTEGKVAVRDLRRARTVLVAAGQSYLARSRAATALAEADDVRARTRPPKATAGG